MTRDWTPIESDPRWDDEDYYDKVKPALDALAQQWSHIHDTEERKYFERQSDFENGFQDYDFEDEAEQIFYTAKKSLERELIDAQMELIDNKLYELGARMMRPYEHWNEDERYMAYMERSWQ